MADYTLMRGCGDNTKLLRSGTKLCHPPTTSWFSSDFPQQLRLTISGTESVDPWGGAYEFMTCSNDPTKWGNPANWPYIPFDALDYCKTWYFQTTNPGHATGGTESYTPAAASTLANGTTTFPTENLSSYNPCGMSSPFPYDLNPMFQPSITFNYGTCFGVNMISFSQHSGWADFNSGDYKNDPPYCGAAQYIISPAPLFRQITIRLVFPLVWRKIGWPASSYMVRSVYTYFVSDPLPGCTKWIRPENFPSKSITLRPHPWLVDYGWPTNCGIGTIAGYFISDPSYKPFHIPGELDNIAGWTDYTATLSWD